MSAAKKAEEKLAKGFNLPKTKKAPSPPKDQAEAFEQAGGTDSLDAPSPKAKYRDEGKAKTRITTYFPPSLAKKLRVTAARQERSMSDLVIDAVEAYLEK